MSDEKVKKILEDIKDLKVSELLEAFNGIIIILPNGEFLSSKEEPKVFPKDEPIDSPNNDQLTFVVVLLEAGEKKVSAIKAVKEITGVGLKEAKEIVESAPIVIGPEVSKQEADRMVKILEDAGAKVELK